MSVFARIAAPVAEGDLAGTVLSLFSHPERRAPRDLAEVALQPPGADAPAEGPRVLGGPAGIGTSAARLPARPQAEQAPPSTGSAEPVHLSLGRHGLGTSALRLVEPPAPVEAPDSEPAAGLELYCPPALRDDVALGEEVNERLLEWAAEVGIYPGQLDRVREANFGRLIMLAHPASDDPDRLLAAAKCVLAEWATDDHFLDDEDLGADAKTIGARLAVTFAAVDPADLPAAYAPQLEQALADEPVAAAYSSAIDHLGRYASATQVARLRHELAVMFMAYNQEAQWRLAGRVPPVWEYLTHRHENSFLPPMVLVDPVAGYEIPAREFADRRVRRAFCLAGTASVVLNDLYSMAKEADSDFDLPKVLAAEEGCTPEQAIEQTVSIHNELMHTFEAEAAMLGQVGSVELRRFLADIWAWLGGNREWHSTTRRYHPVEASTA